MNTLPDLLNTLHDKRTAIIDRKDFRTFSYTAQDFRDLIECTHTLYRTLGVKRGDRIMFYAPNSAEYAAALLACMSMGCVAIPIDAQEPHENLARSAHQHKPALIVHSRSRSVNSAHALIIEELHWRAATPTPFTALDPQTIAQVCPSGAALTHHNLLSAARLHKTTKKNKHISLLPLSDVAEQTAGMLAPLINHASITYLTTLKPSNILDAIRRDHITHTITTPDLLDRLIVSAEPRQTYSSIRTITCIGTPSNDATRFFAHLGKSIQRAIALPEASGIIALGPAQTPALTPLPGVRVRSTRGHLAINSPGVSHTIQKKTKTHEWLHTSIKASVNDDGRIILDKPNNPVTRTREDPLRQIIQQLTKEPIRPQKTLRDLGLSSIDRVDLLTRIEQHYGTDFDDDILDAHITVKNIEKLVKKRKRADQRRITRPWARLLPIRMLRTFVQDFILLPIASLFGEPTVVGLEHLEQLDGPAIFAANHQSHLDVPIILLALPFHLRRRLAIAMWQEFFFTTARTFHNRDARLAYYLSLTFWNCFAFSQQKWFRRSAQYAGELLDNGWNILIFPEGKRTTTNDIDAFRGGIGLFAQEMRTPIVPIRIERVNTLLPIGAFFPRFTRTTVVIGEPLTFTNETPLVATHRIEATIRSLL